MKKVGLLISELNNGGAERVVSRLSHILSNDYKIFLVLFEDTFITYEYKGELINLNVKASSNIIKKFFMTFKRAFILRKIKNEFKLDIVISFMDSPNVVNILSKTKKCKIGISIRNYVIRSNPNTLKTKVFNLLMKQIYNRADIIIPVTKVIAESMINNYKIDRDKFRVIYNPYNIEQIQQLATEEIETHYKGFIDKERTFISVGRQMYQKGFWHLIKAFKLVHDEKQDAKLIIIGKDYQCFRVQKLIDELKLNENVLLVGQHKNPFKFIKNSAVYVLSSLYEGFPNAMAEAMACGCPVIAADCKSGPREILCNDADLEATCKIVEKADFGVLVPPMESEENWDGSVHTVAEESLSEAMLMYLQDKALRKYYADKAIERARDFNFEKCRKDFEDIIEEVLL